MRRYHWALVIAFIIGCICLGGCGFNVPEKSGTLGRKEPEPVKIHFFGNKIVDSQVHVIEDIIASFMADNPGVIVTYEGLKGDKYYEALMKRMEHGVGDDIIMLDHDTILTLKAQGKLSDLSDIGTIESYAENQQCQFMDDDGIYWLPTSESAFGLYCNLDLLAKHGQRVPQNWPEFVQVCDYFTKKGITPVVGNNDISLKTLIVGRSFFTAYQEKKEARKLEQLNRGTIKLGDELNSGLELVYDLVHRGFIDSQRTLITKQTTEELVDFAKGNTPFMLTGVWAADRVKKRLAGRFDFAVHPLPILEDGSMLVVNPDTRLGINADSQHIEEAKRFVAYFTQAENLRRFCEEQCSLNPIQGSKSNDMKEIQPVIECFNQGRTVIGSDSRVNLPIWTMVRRASQQLLENHSVPAVELGLNIWQASYIENHNPKASP